MSFNEIMDFMFELQSLGIIYIEDEDSLIERVETLLEDSMEDRLSLLFGEE